MSNQIRVQKIQEFRKNGKRVTGGEVYKERGDAYVYQGFFTTRGWNYSQEKAERRIINAYNEAL